MGEPALDRPRPTKNTKLMDSYSSVLRHIVDHPFVTADSLRLKDEARGTLNAVKQHIVQRGEKANAAMFVYGSVGVGLAEKDSDVDGLIIHDVSPNAISHDLLDVPLNRKFQHMKAWHVDEVIQDALDHGIINQVLSLPPGSIQYELAFEQLGRAALLFGPSLTEFSDPAEVNMLNEWRKKFLTQLITQYPANAEKIWDQARAYLKNTFVRYEEQTQIGGQEKRDERPKRVTRLIDTKVREMFPNKPDVQARAKRLIEAKRESFVFPPLSEMTEAFEVTPSGS